MKKMLILSLFLFLSAILFGVIGTASATSIVTLEIGVPDSNLASYSAPYAEWEIDLVSSTQANVTVNALTNGNKIYLLGDGSSAAANVNASTFTVSNLTGYNSYFNYSPPSISVLSAGSVSTFGNFNLRLQNFDGSVWALTSLGFTLENTSGTWGNARDVLTNNAAGFMAADHIYVFDSTPAGTTPYNRNQQSNTVPNGYAAVPEPTTLLLLGFGLLGVVGIGRRLKK
jgi:hypothetical protein